MEVEAFELEVWGGCVVVGVFVDGEVGCANGVAHERHSDACGGGEEVGEEGIVLFLWEVVEGLHGCVCDLSGDGSCQWIAGD